MNSFGLFHKKEECSPPFPDLSYITNLAYTLGPHLLDQKARLTLRGHCYVVSSSVILISLWRGNYASCICAIISFSSHRGTYYSHMGGALLPVECLYVVLLRLMNTIVCLFVCLSVWEPVFAQTHRCFFFFLSFSQKDFEIVAENSI